MRFDEGRREALKSLGIIAAGLFVEACRPLGYLVTPTPTRTPEPTVTPTPTATLSTPTPSPTVTPTATPTPEVKDIIEYLQGELVKNIPHLKDYPRASRTAAIQVESQGLTGVLDKYVYPAVELPVKLQVERKIDALNGLGIPDKALEDEAIGQVLLPVELREVNIRTGVRTTANLETGVNNVSLDKDLGKSPQEWLREIGERYFIDKASRVYEEAMWSARRHHPFVPWSYSGESYLSIFDAKRFQDELAIYILGLPGGLFANGITPSHPTSGQVEPYLAVLAGRAFGRPAFVVTAPYPNSPPDRIGTHDEAYVLTNDGSFFGYWLDGEAFLKDYEGKLIKPVLYGKFKPFEL